VQQAEAMALHSAQDVGLQHACPIQRARCDTSCYSKRAASAVSAPLTVSDPHGSSRAPLEEVQQPAL